MGGSGFAVSTSQMLRALVNVREKSSWKVTHGRQEWITAIECISALGEALAPMLISKAKYTNTSRIPTDPSDNRRFTTSNSGRTTDSHALEWAQGTFKPQTRPPGHERRLLIMDGHGRHITARFIFFSMDNAVGLLILLPHCSHVLQPLDLVSFLYWNARLQSNPTPYLGSIQAVSSVCSARKSTFAHAKAQRQKLTLRVAGGLQIWHL